MCQFRQFPAKYRAGRKAPLEELARKLDHEETALRDLELEVMGNSGKTTRSQQVRLMMD